MSLVLHHHDLLFLRQKTSVIISTTLLVNQLISGVIEVLPALDIVFSALFNNVLDLLRFNTSPLQIVLPKGYVILQPIISVLVIIMNFLQCFEGLRHPDSSR